MVRPQLLGAKELIGEFQKLSDLVATQYIDQALQAGAEVVEQSVLRGIWFRTGRLKSAISLKNVNIARSRIVKELDIGPEGFYWRYLAFRTRWRSGPKEGKTKTNADPRLKKAARNRLTTANQTIRDTFRDRVLGFKD